MDKPIRLNESQLRSIIKEVTDDAGPAPSDSSTINSAIESLTTAIIDDLSDRYPDWMTVMRAAEFGEHLDTAIRRVINIYVRSETSNRVSASSRETAAFRARKKR